jgi:hypothetical protein
MAPSFEQGIESFKGNSELEKEYISGLRADCFSEVEELYDFCGRKNQESPLIGVLKTQEQLSWIQGRGRASSWRYITGKRHDGVYEILEGISYVPFAMSCSSQGRIYIGIEIAPEDAERYLGTLYNCLCSEDSQTGVVEKPEEWNIEGGPYQLRDRSLRVLPKFLRGVVVKPSLIIGCDITRTNFGQAYLKSR